MAKTLRVLLFCGWLWMQAAFAQQPEHYYIVESYMENTGMFAQFNVVLGFLDLYDRGKCAGVKVKFGQKGLYYQPELGPNWWNYYCEPISVGNRSGSKIVSTKAAPIPGKRADYIEIERSRQEVHQLIRKYIRFKPHILEKIERQYKQYLEGNFVIGVHYRGTDKAKEAPPVTYRRVVAVLKKYIAEHSIANFRLFVATDEQQFLDYIKVAFPRRVYFQQAQRSTSGNPLHFDNSHPYQHGEEALIDAFLLSKTNVLVRTSSNLSLWSTYLNPHMPVILLNRRNGKGRNT